MKIWILFENDTDLTPDKQQLAHNIMEDAASIGVYVNECHNDSYVCIKKKVKVK